MRLHDLKPNSGAKTRRKRVGRGHGSSRGKTSTRGHKGQGSRAGSSTRATFEGGQMPYIRRLPKRGFNNVRFRTEYVPVNLSDLEKNFDSGVTVDIEAIKKAGLANGGGKVWVKILGNGKLEKKLNVKAHAFSGVAQKAIEEAGGSCEALKSNKPSTDRQETPEQETPEQEAPEQDPSAE